MGMGISLPVSAGERTLSVAVDEDTAERLAGRALSLGSHGYVQFCPPGGDGSCVLLHRWIMGASKGDGRLIDHDDRDKLNCLRSNLLFVTPAESSANVTGTSSSGYRGVSRNRYGRWEARAKQHGRQVYLGLFASVEEAAQVAHDWRAENMPGYRETRPVRHGEVAR